MKHKINKKRPVCAQCGSGYIYITKKKIVCRRCGYEDLKGKIAPAAVDQ